MAEKQKSNMEILNEIRDYRNRQLIETKDNRVFFTVIMALEKGKNTDKQIYRIVEEYSIGENQSLVRELFYEYKDEPQLIAIMDPEKYDGRLLPVGELGDLENKEDWDLIEKDIVDGRTKAKQNIKGQAKELGMSEEEIEGLSEIDIHKRILRRTNELDKNSDKENEAKDEDERKEDDVAFSISGEDARKIGIIGMNTMLLNQKVGVHGETLKSELGIDGKEEYADVDAIEIIPSYKLRELDVKIPDIPFVAVARHRDGSIEAFPESICKIYKGENNEVITRDGQDDKVTRERPSSILQFVGTNTSLAIDQKSPYGIAKASLAYNTRDNDGRVGIELQDKYAGTVPLDREAREVVDPHQGRNNYGNIVDEAEAHPEEEVIEGKDADGDSKTATHIHEDTVIDYEGMEAQFSTLARTIGGCQTEEEVSVLLIMTNQKLQNGTIDPEQALKNAIEERNQNIIQNSYEPQKVQELMERANVNNPNNAIKALEEAEWDVDEAVEVYETQYRNIDN